MLAEDYGDDDLTQELDPNLDDDYIMLFERRKAVQPSKKLLGKYHRRRASQGQNERRINENQWRQQSEGIQPRHRIQDAPSKAIQPRQRIDDTPMPPQPSEDIQPRQWIDDTPMPPQPSEDIQPRQWIDDTPMPPRPSEDIQPRQWIDDTPMPPPPSGGYLGGEEITDPSFRRGDLPHSMFFESRRTTSPTIRDGFGNLPSTVSSGSASPPVTYEGPPEDDDLAHEESTPPTPPPPPKPSGIQPKGIGDRISVASSSAHTSFESGLSQEFDILPVIEDEPINDGIVETIISSIAEDDLHSFTRVLPMLEENEIEIEKFNLSLYVLNNSKFENVLHHALKCGAIKISKYLIQHCPRELFLANCEDRDKVGRRKSKTCLHIIAEKNLPDVAKMMFERMKDREKTSFIYRTGEIRLGGHRYRDVLWIHIACYYGYIDTVKLCLEEGMKPDDTDSSGESCLFWACKRDQLETAEFLLNKKADVNMVSNSGTPPLYMAVRHNSIRCVKLIMEYDPDVSAKRGVGFETPLILASVFGYEEIVQILVDSGADVMEPSCRGETAMHAAASEGWTEIMTILYQSPQGPDTINLVTKTQETPLHFAVAKNQMEATQFLVEQGADLSIRDKHGKTVWHVAVTSHKAPVLFTLLESASPLNWDGKVSPLHLVAETFNSEEEFEVIKMSEIDMTTLDPEENTYLHTAAKYGNISIIRNGVGIINANRQNSAGNTPLHEAARAGHQKAVKLLLRSVKLNIVNESEETALHCAIKSKHASADLVKDIVKHIKNTKLLEVLNAANISGNSALHLAAKYNRPEVVKHLKDISPLMVNKEGDNALHVAARRGNLEALLEILKCFEYEMKINQRTEDGETLLHLVAKGGHVDMINVLIDYGIDLAIQDETGNTFLHDLAEQAGADPDNQDMYNNVFAEVVRDSLTWWCKKNNLTTVDEDSELSLHRRKEALLHLRSEIINNNGLTALQVAVKHGAASLVEKMIQVPLVFVHKTSKAYTYDVTDLVPDTFIHEHKSQLNEVELVSLNGDSSQSTPKMKLSPGSKLILNGMLAESEHLEEPTKPQIKPKPVKASLLEVVVSKRPLSVANVMLDIEPMKQVADGYWMLYQVITCLLLVMHVVYMSVLSAFAVPEIRKVAASNISTNMSMSGNSTTGANADPNPMFGFFLLWPLAIVLQESYYIAHRIYRLVKKLDVSEPAFDEIRSDPKQPVGFSDGALALILYYLPHVVNFTFALFVIVWFQLYISGSRYQGIVLAYVMLIGWLTTIAYTRTFRPMHSFTVMLRNIFIKDVLKFLFLYVFIMLAFGFAFDCLASLSLKIYSEFDGSPDIFYQTVGMLLGAGDMMIEDIEDKYKISGYSPTHYKMLYLLYALVTVVVLLNILIAMMNDSYGDIKSKEGVSFRVLSIQQAIQFEKAVPFMHIWFKKLRQQQQQFYKQEKQWYMVVEVDEMPPEAKSDDRHALLLNLSTKLDKLSQQQMSIMGAINNLNVRVNRLERPEFAQINQQQEQVPMNQTQPQPQPQPQPQMDDVNTAPVYKPDLFESSRFVRFRID